MKKVQTTLQLCPRDVVSGRIALFRTVITLLLLLIGTRLSYSQTMSNLVRYEYTNLSSGGTVQVVDPLYYEESVSLLNYKQDRKFRLELHYNRNNHTDLSTGTLWRLTLTATCLQTGQSEDLKLEFSPDSPTYMSWAEFVNPANSPASFSMSWQTTNILIEKWDGTGWITGSNSDLPAQDIHLECLSLNERMSFLSLSGSQAKMSFDETKSELSWDYIRGAIEYDVEWVFIDEQDAFTYNSNEPKGPFDFKEPVRITTYKHYHVLDLIYPKGTLYFRVRPKGYFSKSSSQHEVYMAGDWSYGTKSGSGNMLYVLTSDYEASKNWQYTVAYAENGMSKSAVSYMDGTLRSRMALTKMKSSDQVVAAATVYDAEGRQAVQVVPTPVVSGSLNYINQLHKDAGGGIFDKGDFDYGVSNPLGTGSGAGRYYSASNDFTNDPFRERIPDAEGYAYVQTDFSNDNTGRPVQTSGVGKAHRLGGGHETKYFYVNPTQRDLIELFGSNVGNAKYYEKQIAVDANGQVSVSYTDQKGRVIATALAQDKPANLEALDNNLLYAGTVKTSSLMGNNIITEENGLKVSKVEYNHFNMGTGTIKLDYDLTSVAINNDPAFGPGACASCFYKLEVHVYDPDGLEINMAYDPVTQAGVQNLVFMQENYSAATVTCGTPGYDPAVAAVTTGNLSLTKTGNYKIVKILSVDQNAVQNYMATSGVSLPNTPLLSSITSSYLNAVITTGCGFDCTAYYEQECRAENGFSLTGTLNATQQGIVSACVNAKCAAADDAEILDQQTGNDADYCANMLDAMKLDVSPGGWVFEEDIAWRDNQANWNYPLNLTGGGTYSPAGLFSNLEENWDDNFANQLVLKHPEYCHYTKCTALRTLKAYNETLMQIPDWATAQSGGYINGSGVINTAMDPLSTSPLYSGLMTTFNSLVTNYNGPNQSIYTYIVNCSPSIVTDNTGAVIAPSNQPAYNNRVWELMRSFYAGVREDFMEDYYVYAAPCNALPYLGGYYQNENANFISPNAALAENDPAIFNSMESGAGCADACQYNVSYWLQRITEECSSLTPSQITTITQHLQNYCLTDCDGFNNLTGAIQSTDLTINSNLTAVQGILNGASCGSFSLTNLSVNTACSNPVTVAVAQNALTSTTIKNMGLLNTLENDQYAMFITTPAIVSVANYQTLFPLSHWTSANMQVTFYTSAGTSIYTVNTIEDISILEFQEYLIGTDLFSRFKIKVTKTDGTSAIFWTDKFDLKTNGIPNTLTFLLNGMYKASMNVTICQDTQNDAFEVVINYNNYVQDCQDDITEEAEILAQLSYQDQLETFLSNLQNSFSKNCFGQGLSEQFAITYTKKEYDYTLFYYDLAGNLVQTVPPQGVNLVLASAFDVNGVWNGTTQPAHTMPTIYTYNTMNQPIKTSTPDGGVSQIWYNDAGQARLSQDAEQAKPVATKVKYSYVRYDALGRPYEAGVFSDAQSANPAANALTTTYPVISGSAPATEVVITRYDKQDLTLDPTLGWNPQNLATRVAAVAYYDSYTGNNDLYNNAQFYTYDIHGNVTTLFTDTRTLDGTNICNNNIRYKKIDYVFDLYSGKMKEVWYQKEQEDQFIHHYEYDDDNRITAVYTSENGVKWEEDARYYYYLHGPLARVELGDSKVQGIDYAYTVHGWLKGVNSNTATASRDLGRDGTIIDETGLTALQKQQRKRNRWVAQDAYGFSLTYFNTATEQDYKAIDSYVNPWLASNENVILPSTNGNLYNGNIRAMVTALKNTNNQNIGTVARVYKYDQLQRLKEAQTWTAANVDANNSWTGAATTLAHYFSASYDLNGNITRFKRNGGNTTTPTMDDFTYYYETAGGGTTTLPTDRNRLKYIVDGVAVGNYNDDMESSTTQTNYVYDDAGRLVKDLDNDLLNITWTAQNKVAYIQRKTTSMASDLAFKYNSFGQRIAKIEYVKSAPNTINLATSKITFYALDGNGEVMATYSQTGVTSTTVLFDEVMLYGSTLLGTKNMGKTLATSSNYDYIASDNRASAIVEVTASTFTSGQTVQLRVGSSTSLGSAVTWGTTLATNVTNLVNAVNSSTVTTDVSAKVVWSRNVANTYMIQLKYGQQANYNRQDLFVIVNGSASSTHASIKRKLGFGTAKGSYVLGRKRFHLANHLNNVLAIITDRKLGIDDGQYNPTTGVKTSSTLDGYVDYYQPEIVKFTDYDPFGTEQTSRSGGTRGKFGFQGQLLDDEVKGNGNSVNYEYRMHDPRIGRFFAIDPLAPKYPHNSPYAFSENTVINAVELEGLERRYTFNSAYLTEKLLPKLKNQSFKEIKAYVDGLVGIYFENGEELEYAKRKLGKEFMENGGYASDGVSTLNGGDRAVVGGFEGEYSKNDVLYIRLAIDNGNGTWSTKNIVIFDYTSQLMKYKGTDKAIDKKVEKRIAYLNKQREDAAEIARNQEAGNNDTPGNIGSLSNGEAGLVWTLLRVTELAISVKKAQSTGDKELDRLIDRKREIAKKIEELENRKTKLQNEADQSGTELIIK